MLKNKKSKIVAFVILILLTIVIMFFSYNVFLFLLEDLMNLTI